MLLNSPNDISSQIDRILSSNIATDIFGSLYDKLIASPLISKKSRVKIQSPQNLKSSNTKSQIDKSMFQQNLYEKAEQIFKLHSMLQTQIQHINELVSDNQILQNQNQDLKQQVQRMKKELNKNKQFYVEIIDSKTRQINKINNQLNDLKKKQINQSLQLKFKIHRQFQQKVVKNIQNTQKQSYIDLQCSQLKNRIKIIGQQILLLRKENLNLKQSLNMKNAVNNCQKQQNIKNKCEYNQIDYYQSVFLKSQANQIDQIQKIKQKIRLNIFGSSPQSFFGFLQSIKYRGQIIQGHKTGLGTQEYINKFKYEGFFFNNQRQGLGRLLYQDQLIYEGQWRNGKFSGKGTIYISQNVEIKKIQGNFKNGSLNGYALITFKSGSKQRVRFKQNAINSQSILI